MADIECDNFLTDREIFIRILEELTIANSGGTVVTFQENILFIRNNGGTIEISNDEIIWATNVGPHIPANVNSFYIMNLGLTGDGLPFEDITLDLNGTAKTMNPQEVTWRETVEDGKDNLVGNISVTPFLSHVVKVGYKIKI